MIKNRHDGENSIDPERYDLRYIDNSAEGNFNVVTRMEGRYKNRMISLIRRSPKPLPSFMRPPNQEKEMDMREKLASLGVPVIPTFRIGQDGNIYATDLTKRRSKYVVSWNNRSFDETELNDRTLEGEFGSVKNVGEIMEQACAIARTCAKAGIRMKNADALYLVIDKKTRDTNIYAGDYKHFEDAYVHPLDTDSEDYTELLNQNLSECYMLFATPRIRGIFGMDLEAVKRKFPTP